MNIKQLKTTSTTDVKEAIVVPDATDPTKTILQATRTDGTKYDIDVTQLKDADGTLYLGGRADDATGLPSVAELTSANGGTAPTLKNGDALVLNLKSGGFIGWKYNAGVWTEQLREIPLANIGKLEVNNDAFTDTETQKTFDDKVWTILQSNPVIVLASGEAQQVNKTNAYAKGDTVGATPPFSAGKTYSTAIYDTVAKTFTVDYYIGVGTEWQKWNQASIIVPLTDAQAKSLTDTTFGTISGKQLNDREQAIKGIVANFTDTNTDHQIAKTWDAETLASFFATKTELDKKENKVDATKFKAVGSENTIGLNVNDDTAQKIFEKIDAYKALIPESLKSVILVTAENLSDAQKNLTTTAVDDLLFEWATTPISYTAIPLNKFVDKKAYSSHKYKDATGTDANIVEFTSIDGTKTELDLNKFVNKIGVIADFDRNATDYNVGKLQSAQTIRESELLDRYLDTGSIDLNAVMGDVAKEQTFTSNVALTNAPEGMAQASGYYLNHGDKTKGVQYLYLTDAPLAFLGDYYRTWTNGTPSAWNQTQSDEWVTSFSGNRNLVQGDRVWVKDGTLTLPVADDLQAIRVASASDWANFGGFILPNSWTLIGQIPTAGNQEIVLLPEIVKQEWHALTVPIPVLPTVMTGATTLIDGKEGLVPKPVKADVGKFLSASGAFEGVPILTGATTTIDGASGLAPKPVKTDNEKVLFGDATYKLLISGSSPMANSQEIRQIGELRTAVIAGITTLFRWTGTVPHTTANNSTGAGLSAELASGWQYVSQQRVPVIVADNASTYYVAGFIVKDVQNRQYQCLSAGTSSVSDLVTPAIWDKLDADTENGIVSYFDVAQDYGTGATQRPYAISLLDNKLYEVLVADVNGTADPKNNPTEWKVAGVAGGVLEMPLGETVQSGELRLVQLGSSWVTLRYGGTTPRTTKANARTTDLVAEITEGGWTFFDQNETPRVVVAPATQFYPSGMRVLGGALDNPVEYEKVGNESTNDSTLTNTAKWTSLGSPSKNEYVAWTGSTTFKANAPIFANLSPNVWYFRATAGFTSGATFNNVSWDNLKLVGQEDVNAFQANAFYPKGGKIVDANGVTWQKKTSGTVGTAFVQSDWTNLTPLGLGRQFQPYLANEVITEQPAFRRFTFWGVPVMMRYTGTVPHTCNANVVTELGTSGNGWAYEYQTEFDIAPSANDWICPNLLFTKGDGSFWRYQNTTFQQVNTVHVVEGGWFQKLAGETSQILTGYGRVPTNYNTTTGTGDLAVYAGTIWIFGNRLFTPTDDFDETDPTAGCDWREISINSQPTIQNINATGAITAWNSVVEIGATAPTANVIATLPTVTMADIGKSITIIRKHSNSFGVSVVGASGQTVNFLNAQSELASQGGAITLTAISATQVDQTQNNIKDTGQTVVPLQFANLTRQSTTAVTLTSQGWTTAFASMTKLALVSGATATEDAWGLARSATNDFLIKQAGRYELRLFLPFETGDAYGIAIGRNNTELKRYSFDSSVGNAQFDAPISLVVDLGNLAVNDVIDVRLCGHSGTVRYYSFEVSLKQVSVAVLPHISTTLQIATAVTITTTAQTFLEGGTTRTLYEGVTGQVLTFVPPANQVLGGITSTPANLCQLRNGGNNEASIEIPRGTGNVSVTPTFIPAPTPVLQNFPVRTTRSTYFTPTTGGTRTGGVWRPPANSTDLELGDGNWDGEVELPQAPVAGAVLYLRNSATLATTLRILNTNLIAPLVLANSRSICFVSDANRVWRWQDAPFMLLNDAHINTTPLNLGNFTTNGGAGVSIGMVHPRAGVRISSFTFTFRDRRTSTFPSRTGSCTINMTGDITRFENANRYGIYQEFNLGGATYGALVQWVPLPGGSVGLYLQDLHSSAWNSYGEFLNFTVNWVAS